MSILRATRRSKRLVPCLVVGALLGLASCSATAAEPEQSGWVTLFDGATLDGWTPVGGRYDGHASWTVEDGALTGREGPGRAGGLLYTTELYSDFEFECEVRLDWPFDSGIFLRMAPEGKGAQITIDHRPGGEIAAVYSDGYLMHNEGAAEGFRRGEWNHFRVRCTGADFRLEAWLNGERVVDYQLPAGSPGYAPTGRIGVQVHGDSESPVGAKVQFRALRVRPLTR